MALLVDQTPHRARPSASTPNRDSVRERLLAGLAAGLTDDEIIGALTSTKRRERQERGAALLEVLGGLQGLINITPSSLQEAGLGEESAATVLAAVELAVRLTRLTVPVASPLDRPNLIARYLSLRYSKSNQEVLGALFLNTRNALLADAEFFRGTLNRVAVEPRQILTEALLHHAAGVVLFHTHPSGDPAPSGDDWVFTRRFAKAANVIGIRLVDHLIVTTGGGWVSMKQQGHW